jgi:hypothetical protein
MSYGLRAMSLSSNVILAFLISRAVLRPLLVVINLGLPPFAANFLDHDRLGVHAFNHT